MALGSLANYRAVSFFALGNPFREVGTVAFPFFFVDLQSQLSSFHNIVD